MKNTGLSYSLYLLVVLYTGLWGWHDNDSPCIRNIFRLVDAPSEHTTMTLSFLCSILSLASHTISKRCSAFTRRGREVVEASWRLPHTQWLQSSLSPQCPLSPLGLKGSHLCKQQFVECVCDEWYLSLFLALSIMNTFFRELSSIG